MSKIDISVVIPAYNEAERLGPTLKEWTRFFCGQKKQVEIIVVNDGSFDETSQVIDIAARTLPVDIRILGHDVNRGKGFSVRKGMLDAKGEILIYTDADLPVRPDRLESFIALLESGIDVVIGSRHIAGSRIGCRQPRYREILGSMFIRLAHIATSSVVTDFNCAFKVFRRHAAHEIFSRQTLSGWGFEVEILLIAQRLGFKIKEQPVTWFNGKNSRVRVFKDIPRSIADLGLIAWNNLRGSYDKPQNLNHRASEKQGI